MDLDSGLVSALIESREINYAFASLLFYDHVLCSGEEVEYFWTGPWSLSRFLYLAIRYMSLGFALRSFNHPNWNVVSRESSYQRTSCNLITVSWISTAPAATILFVKLFVFIIPISILCQSVITLRIWYLFSRSLVVRILVVAMLFATAVTNTLMVAYQWRTIQLELLHPRLFSKKSFAWIYVPSLLSHSVLFALKVYRFLASSVRTRTNSLLWGFLKEGMFMYVFAMVSLMFGVVGLAMVEPSQASVRIPAAIASPIVATVAVSVCRVMLSIRSVAATAHVDPEWLLNHAELSRVHWRRGEADGEIIVAASEFTVSFNTKHSSSLA